MSEDPSILDELSNDEKSWALYGHWLLEKDSPVRLVVIGGMKSGKTVRTFESVEQAKSFIKDNGISVRERY